MQNNNYTIVSKIGEGSHSQIYHIKLGNDDYAMKKINMTSIPKGQKKYLLSELKIISEHNCKNIIKFYTAFLQEDFMCIIMEYCSKGTLQNIIKRKHISTETVWKYFSQTCGAIHYLHKNNIIHRDLNSSNILIDSNDNIKLIDFGVSKILNNYMKYTKSFVGTTYCMSPELVKKNTFYDHKIDIWSLGILMYQMTHYKHPFKFKTSYAYELKPDISPAFKIIIQKCIQEAPHKRIKLDILLQHSEIKKHINKLEYMPKKIINQIDKIPSYQQEWEKIIKQIPNNIPRPKTVAEQKKCQSNIAFMQHYTKDRLIFFNMRLIDEIINKNSEIEELKKKLSDFHSIIN